MEHERSGWRRPALSFKVYRKIGDGRYQVGGLERAEETIAPGRAKAGCRVGEVTRANVVTARSGKVIRQCPKPGGVLAPATKVKLTLGT
jgi:hypothetical protein